MGEPWVTTEDEIIKLYSRPDNWLSSNKFGDLLLDRSPTSICARRNKFGLKPPISKYNWTEEKIKYLKDNYLTMSEDELCKNLNATINQLTKQKSRLRLIKKNIVWTEEKEQFIKDNYIKFSNVEIAKKFSIGVIRVREKLSELKLTRAIRWSIEDDDFLRDNYLKFTDEELAIELNKISKYYIGAHNVKSRRGQLRLSKQILHSRVTLKCEKCGKEFTAKYADRERKFCSFKCSIHDDWTNEQIGRLIIETIKGTPRDKIATIIRKSKKECDYKLDVTGLKCLKGYSKPLYSLILKDKNYSHKYIPKSKVV